MNLPLFETSKTAGTAMNPDVALIQGDAHTLIAAQPDRSIDLIITSPPYNLGKDYEQRRSLDSYLEQQRAFIPHLIRILKSSGSLCWQVGNYVDDGEVFPLDIFYYPLFKAHGLQLRNRIVWHFEHGLHSTKRFSGRYETLLWFTKTDEYTFNLDPVRIPAKYPGKLHYKGPNKGKPSGNPHGKNPSDVWAILMDDWEAAFWDIPNVKSNHPEKTIHPCQFPVELVERCVLALTNKGDTVFDPYAGVGSSLIAARKHARRGIGYEQDANYVQLAHQRFAAYENGTLKTRPLGKPIHQPTGREKVAQRPITWDEDES
jgi:DNA modification methylase